MFVKGRKLLFGIYRLSPLSHVIYSRLRLSKPRNHVSELGYLRIPTKY